MKTHAWKKLVVGLVVALMLVSLSGCDILYLFSPEAGWMAEQFFYEWMEAKNLNTTNEDGGVNAGGVINAGKRALTDSTGDEESDAALDFKFIQDIGEAENLADKAFKERKTQYLDQAIALQPNDWAYRLDRAALNMHVHFQPDMDQVEKDFEVADSLLGPGKSERIQFAQRGIRQMEWVKEALSRKPDTGPAVLWKDARQCRAVFGRLAHYHDMLADQTGSTTDRQLAAQYRQDMGQCRDQ